jgi:hypothetical protein
VHETDAAWELVQAALAPFEMGLRRCIELDLMLEAAAHGVLSSIRQATPSARIDASSCTTCLPCSDPGSRSGS